MKKYSLVLLFATLIFSFFSVLTVDASVSGCMTGDRYSRTTGQACITSETSSCRSGEIYNAYTGERCSTIPPVPSSCDMSYDQSLTFGSRGTRVAKLQQILKDARLFYGIVDGIYGPMTDGSRKAYERECEDGSINLKIEGPETLNINQRGTWTLDASDTNDGRLSYQVSWGDEGYATSTGLYALSPSQQSSTFTHKYTQKGIYTVTFIATSSSSGSVTKTTRVNVGKAEETNITVLSPNGGEVYTLGGNLRYAVKYSSKTTGDICHYLTTQKDYLNATRYKISCGGGYKSRNTDSSGSVILDNRVFSTGTYYLLSIWENSDNSRDLVYDFSDASFRITNGTTTSQPSIRLEAFSGGDSSDSSITATLGSNIKISGVPKNLQGLSYYYGTAGYPPTGYYNRAFFFDQNFSNNNDCSNNNGSTNQTWIIECTAKVLGSSYFYVEIYANGQTYRSNTVTVNIIGNTTPLAITTTSPLPNAKVGVQYKAYLYATEKLGYYNWSVINSSLPSGLTFTSSDDCGVNDSNMSNVSNCILIFGTPATSGIYNPNIRVSLGSQIATKVLRLTVDPAAPVVSVSTPVISSLSSTSGSIGSAVTINGSGFSATSNTINFGSNVFPNIASTNNRTKILFDVPAYSSPACLFTVPACTQQSMPISPGSYKVSVYNKDSLRTSNEISFSVVNPTVDPDPVVAKRSLPAGTLDQANCSAVAGWAIDWDTPNSPLQIQIFDGPAGGTKVPTGYATANITRPDLNPGAGISKDHGFVWSIPASLKNNVAHTLYVYAVDAQDGTQSKQLNGSPKSITCGSAQAANASQGASAGGSFLGKLKFWKW